MTFGNKEKKQQTPYKEYKGLKKERDKTFKRASKGEEEKQDWKKAERKLFDFQKDILKKGILGRNKELLEMWDKIQKEVYVSIELVKLEEKFNRIFKEELKKL
jgi:hypothetical protein